MKTMVVLLGTVGVAFGFTSWGLPQPVHDTPEVAAAKRSHLAALAKAKSSFSAWGVLERSGPEDDGSWKDDGSSQQYDDGAWRDDTRSWNQERSSAHWDSHEKKWTGPVALPPGYDKHGAPLQVLDTPEVAAAKQSHLAALAKAKSSFQTWGVLERSGPEDGGSWKDDGALQQYDDGAWRDDTQSWNQERSSAHWDSHAKKWTGPVALPPGYDKHGAPLQVLDTPEVAAAKQFHLAALAKAKSSFPTWGVLERSGPEDDGSWKDDGSSQHYDDGAWRDDTRSWNREQSSAHWDSHEKKWTGPVALPPGYDKHGAPLQVLDTPEVSAEKAKHFHLYSHAAAKAAPSAWYH